MKKMTVEETISALKLRRREFLALSVMGALPGLLTGCLGDTTTGSGTPTPTASVGHATATPSPAKQPPSTPTSADWSQLAQSLQGTLVLPGSSQYPTALQLFDPQFDTIHPTAIAYCASPADVQKCLAFVPRFNLSLSLRSGGHSYAGYSTTTGLLVDVTRMNEVSVNTSAGTATIGCGNAPDRCLRGARANMVWSSRLVPAQRWASLA